jgi:inosine-uridine nucleoside N-ribohydrolase
MAINKEINMDISKQSTYVSMHFPQGDNIDRKFYINLFDGSDEYVIPSSAIARFQMTKFNGSVIYNNCPIINNQIVFEVTPAISAEAGRHPAQFKLTDSMTGGELKSFRFHILLEENVDIDSVVVNTSEFTALQDMELRLGDADAILSGAEAATINANSAASNANEATTKANTEATNANIAASNANSKASLADVAASNADSKASLANNAATNAYEKADLANIATSNANSATSNANSAANNANTIANKLNTETLKIYKGTVSNYSDLATTFPTPENAWTVNVTNPQPTSYRWNGIEWIDLGVISAIETATDTNLGVVKGGDVKIAVDGTMSVPSLGDPTQLNTIEKTKLVLAVNEVLSNANLNGKGPTFDDTLIQPTELPMGLTTNLISTHALGLGNIIPYTWNVVVHIRSYGDDSGSCVQQLYTTSGMLWRFGTIANGWDTEWKKIDMINTYIAPANNIILSSDIHKGGDFDDYFDNVMLYSMNNIKLNVFVDRGDVTIPIDESGISVLDNLNTVTSKSIPHYLGLNKNLSESDKTGTQSDSQLQANIQNLLDKIRMAAEKTTIFAVGSLRDIAAAYNISPSLFQNKVDRIYVFAGDAEGTYLEFNVELNEWAYLNIMNSGLPIYWVPCFQNGLWSTGNDTSYFTTTHNELFDSTTSSLFKWFLFYWSSSTDNFNDFISQAHDSTTFMADTRNIWCSSLIPLMIGNNYAMFLQQYNVEKGTSIAEPFSFIEDTMNFASGGVVQHGVGHIIHRFHINDRTNYIAFSKWIIKKMINNMEL